MTFDFPVIFRANFVFFPVHALLFEWLDLATSFIVWRYIFRISRTHSSFKVMGSSQGHSCEKAVTCDSKNTGEKLMELDHSMCYDNTRSDLEFLTFDLWPIFQFKFWAASSLMWRYIISINVSPSRFDVMGLISRLWQQKAAGLCSTLTQLNYVRLCFIA